jgi:hypothetical protein
VSSSTGAVGAAVHAAVGRFVSKRVRNYQYNPAVVWILLDQLWVR